MNRRTFIHTAGAAGLGLGGRFSLTGAVESDRGLLSVLEESPRERLPRDLVRLIQAGLRYEDLLAALSLAAARNVRPYPDVGFKYHVLMMLRSIHSTTGHLSGPDRWLPIIWGAEYFKDAQAQERAVSGWRMPAKVALVESDPQAARAALITALDTWDRDAADTAIVNYARAAHPEEVFSILFPYGARDLRAIGHKAIEVSNAHYLITLLGPGAHTEPILRSTVAALQNSDEDADPGKHDFPPDRPWRKSRERLQQIPKGWQQARGDSPKSRAELRAALYEVSAEKAGAVVVDFLRQGISPSALWQVMSDLAAELIMLRPGVVTLHAQTTTNALHYAYRNSADERTQQMMLLQCAAFLALFQQFVSAQGTRLNLAELQPLPLEHAAREANEEIFADLAAGRRLTAARKCLGYLHDGGAAAGLIATVRHHLVYGVDEVHDYKFTEAVLDTYDQPSDAGLAAGTGLAAGNGQPADPGWRQRFLSAGMAYFKAPATRPNPIVSETLELLQQGSAAARCKDLNRSGRPLQTRA